MKSAKWIVPLILIILLLTVVMTAHTAKSGQGNSADPEAPKGLSTDPWEFMDQRGEYAPTLDTTLPYTASANIYDFVYTNRKFKPSSTGKLVTVFNGSLTNLSGGSTSQTSAVTISLYKQGKASPVEKHTYAKAQSWTNKKLEWTGLDSSGEYYFQVSKSNLLTYMPFTLKITCS